MPYFRRSRSYWVLSSLTQRHCRRLLILDGIISYIRAGVMRAQRNLRAMPAAAFVVIFVAAPGTLLDANSFDMLYFRTCHVMRRRHAQKARQLTSLILCDIIDFRQAVCLFKKHAARLMLTYLQRARVYMAYARRCAATCFGSLSERSGVSSREVMATPDVHEHDAFGQEDVEIDK